MTIHFEGTLPALATPFTKDAESIDFSSLENLINYVLEGGVNGVVACGSTGEAATLSDDEYKKVVELSRKLTKGKIHCVAGIGTNSTSRAIEMAKYLEGTGIDGILLVAPPYNKPPQEGIFQHFASVKKATTLPIIAYNVPGRTSVNIVAKTIGKLVSEGIIVGLKEASGSMDQAMDIMSLVKGKLSLLSGEDSLVHAMMACGGKGVISTSANIIPDVFVRLTNAALAGRYEESLDAQLEALPVVRAMFAETNPMPLKAALAMKGVIKHPTVRLPLMQVSGATIELIKSALKL